MSIGINGAGYNYGYKAASAKNAKAGEAKVNEQAEVEKKESAPAQKPETFKPDMDKINSMKADLKSNTLAFKQMVYSMFKQQGSFADTALNALMNIDSETQLAAQDAISDDGFWGVEQTAQRLLDFAKALSGGDISKVPELRDAIMKGFEAAEKIWGGELPEICYKTREKVMETMDEWVKSGKME